MSTPNILTISRILLIPVFVAVFYLPYDWHYISSAAIFSIAAITDGLDGYLARKLKQESRFGAFLDPVADKLMVSVALVLLVSAHADTLLTIPALVIIGRELVISALREWMAEIGQRKKINVALIGKIKTTAQMTAIIALLLSPVGIISAWIIIGYISLYIAAVLTLWSMVQYLQAAWPDLSQDLDLSKPVASKIEHNTNKV